jgi:hypothetical protein
VHHQYLRALLEANAANTQGEFQELDTFVLGPHAEDFEIEGATLIPTLRVQLDSVVKAYALVVARCTDVLPDAATLTVQIPRLRQLGGDAELSGNLDAPTLRCVRRRGRMLQSLVALLLGQIPSEDELRISARVVDVGGAPDTRDVANEGAESIEGASGERSLRVTLVRAAP